MTSGLPVSKLNIARPLGLHYNYHYVNPSIHPLPVGENVHISLITWYIFITFFTCFFDRYGFAVHLPSLLWSAGENPHGS